MLKNNKEILNKKILNLPHNCAVKLLAIFETLQSAERKVVDLLIERTDLFRTASVYEIAKLAKTSVATIVRLFQKLGYQGYAEFKSDLNLIKDKTPSKFYDDITQDDDYETVLKKVYKATIISLKDTFRIVNIKEFEKAVETIFEAKKIVFCGEGDASVVARAAYLKFVRIGINAILAQEIDSQLIAVANLEKKDVLFAISYSGRTKNIVELVKYAKKLGITVISITNYPLSPLSKNSDIILLTATFAEDIMGEIISKRVSELYLIEAIYISLIMKQKEKFEQVFEKSNEALLLNKIIASKNKSIYYKK